MNEDTHCSLSYENVARRTEEAIRTVRTTMPNIETDEFTSGYLKGILFHWHLMAREAGLSASMIDEEEERLQQLAILPECR